MFMKKKSLLLLLTGLTVLFSLGCGKKAENAAPETTAETFANADTEITGYLIDDAEQYVTLGNYKGIDIEQPVYEVTDDEVNMEIENQRYNYSSITPASRPAQEGDLVTLDLTATPEGTDAPDMDETDYTVEIGAEEFGTDFDQELTGVNVGDKKEITCSFDEDSWYDEWIGKNVTFQVTVKAVEEMKTPEYNEDYIKNTLGYESQEAYEKSVRDMLTENYAEQGEAEAKENALLTVIDSSTFNGYPDKLYDACKESVTGTYKSFAELYGMELEELYEAYELTEEDLEEEIMDTVNRRLLVSALCQKENLTVTTGEYTVFLNDQYAYYGYENADSFETEYGKEALMWIIYEDKVCTLLLENGTISEVPASLEFEDMEIDLGEFEEETDGEEDEAVQEETFSAIE